MANDIVTIIGNTGFPIAAFLILCWYINEQGKRHEEEVKGLREMYEKTVGILVQVSDTLQELKDLWTK